MVNNFAVGEGVGADSGLFSLSSFSGTIGAGGRWTKLAGLVHTPFDANVNCSKVNKEDGSDCGGGCGCDRALQYVGLVPSINIDVDISRVESHERLQ